MAKRYIRVNFQNAPSTVTPLSATILNTLDKGIDDCDNAIEAINADLVVEDLSSSVSVSLTGLTVKLRRYGKHIYVLDFSYSGTAAITNGIVCASIQTAAYRPTSAGIASAAAYNAVLIYSAPAITAEISGNITLSGCTVASGNTAIVNGQVVWIK